MSTIQLHPSELDFSLYLEGELSLEQEISFEKHVHRCRRCQELLQGTLEVDGMLHALASSPDAQVATAASQP